MGKTKPNSPVWRPFIGWGSKEIAMMIIAIALNSVLIVAFNPLSWGPMQFRIAEIITVPMYMMFGYAGAIGLLLSSFVTVWFAPGGWIAGEFIWNWTMFIFWGAIPVELVKRLGRGDLSYQIVALYTAICTAIWVPLMLYTMWGVPLMPTMLWIAVAELITMNGLGYILWKGVRARALSMLPGL